jgi:hypothetical protein
LPFQSPFPVNSRHRSFRVEAHVYFVRRDNAEFKPTIAELADAGLEPISVIDYAIKTLSKRGEVKVDLPHHVMQVFGRQLSIVEGNGSRVAAAVFVYRGRLYQVEGKSFPAGNDATADATRFVQSLIFTGGGPTPDETGAAQSACDGSHGPGGVGAHGAAVTDCRDRELPENGDVPRSPLPENGSLMPSAGEPTRKINLTLGRRARSIVWRYRCCQGCLHGMRLGWPSAIQLNRNFRNATYTGARNSFMIH